MAKKKGNGGQKPQKKFSLKEYLRTKMRSLPLGKCYIAPEGGNFSEVTVIVTREHPAGTVSAGMFLIDKYCCGVKDATLHFSIDKDELEDMLHGLDNSIGVEEITYTEVHNLIYGALEYAEEIGIPPHKDFEEAQYVLAEDTDDIPLIEYEYGYEGKPFLICRTQRELDYYRNMMLKVLKPEDFHTLVGVAYPDTKPQDHASSKEETQETETDVEYKLGYDHEIRIHSDQHGDRTIPYSALGPLTYDRTEGIKKLDNARKVALFMLMTGLAKAVKIKINDLTSYITAAEQALHTYRRYGDLAFGEASELLHKAVVTVNDMMTTTSDKPYSADDFNDLIHLCLGYAHSVHQINLMQEYFVKDIVEDTEHGTERIVDVCYGWEANLINSLFEILADNGQETGEVPFRVNGLRPLSKEWHKRPIHSHVHKVKYGFVSKDPINYYKRKVRETLDTQFTSAEDFMGLVVIFHNLTMSCLNFVRQGHTEQAYHIVLNILIETLWTLCSGRFDQWIANDESVRENFMAMLSNTVAIFTHMICGEMVDQDEIGYIYRNCIRLKIALWEKYSGLIDLHPMLYALESQLTYY